MRLDWLSLGPFWVVVKIEKGWFGSMLERAAVNLSDQEADYLRQMKEALGVLDDEELATILENEAEEIFLLGCRARGKERRSKMRPKVTLITDGSCLGNPGPGGWAAILVCKEHTREISGYLPDTTNNRAELVAVLEGLLALKRPCRVEVLSDSNLVVRYINGSCKRKNRRLRQIAKAIEQAADARGHTIRASHVTAHGGHVLNERADKLAHDAALLGAGR